MIRSRQVRIDCNILKITDALVKKNPLYGTSRKFIELAILEKIERTKK